MRLYAAMDLHSNNSVLAILDEQDRVVHERRLPNEIERVLTALAPYRDDVQAIAVESTFNWYWLVDGLMDAGYTVKLVNTAAVKVYEGLKYTADEHDARHLAHLLRLGILPTGYIYPKEERAVRDLLRKRAQLVRCRTAQILSVENLVSRNSGNGISTKEVRQLDEEAIGQVCGGDKMRMLAIQSNLAVLRCLDEQIQELERVVLKQAKLKPEFKKLLTVDGIWNILAMTIMYEAGNMERFAKVGQFASYARCVGSSRWSNGKKKGEGNRKNGNKYLGWAFVEAAHFAMRKERIRRFYERKKAKTNGIVAVKAVAHKLARACYHVLKDQVSFDLARAFA
ncbi:MAG: IS110 family transposase [Elusimicrobia bacterium RIFCSPHIGHO2_02_FULL_61_10]|nr:MAG: IS110 family transposase [Elusimicrobia bacterium RIFCSPHIGHO2_02_FULL_61_10]